MDLARGGSGFCPGRGPVWYFFEFEGSDLSNFGDFLEFSVIFCNFGDFLEFSSIFSNFHQFSRILVNFHENGSIFRFWATLSGPDL